MASCVCSEFVRLIWHKTIFLINLNKHQQMDLDSLSPEQIESALKLCDILSLQDMTVAATVLSSYNWNVQKALSELQLGQVQSAYLGAPTLNKQQYPVSNSDYSYDDVDNEDDGFYEMEDEYQYDLIDQKKKMFEEQYVSLVPLQKTHSEPNKQLLILQNHRRLAEEDPNHRKLYLGDLLKKSEEICNKLLQSDQTNLQKYQENKRKIENNRSFLNFLYSTYKPRINFTFGTFFINLTRAYLENKYLLVYIHSAAPEIQAKFSKIVELILRQKEIAKFVNENCITYGMFDNSDDYELIQKYVPLKDLPAFALFRLNKSKKAQQFISTYKISSQGDIFLEWAAKSMGIALKKKEGSHIELEKAAKEEMKRKEVTEQKQKEQDLAKQKQEQQYIAHRDIREQQDELWAELVKMNMERKQLSLDRKENLKSMEEDLQKRKQEAQKIMEPEAGPNVIEIRFRMPVSGQAKARRFLMEDKVSTMFTYVDCFCRDQFEQMFNDFDIRQSFPPISLMDKKDKTISEVFEGSSRENVIVREL